MPVRRRRHAVADGIHHTSALLPDRAISQVSVCVERLERCCLVLGDQAATADRVG